MTLLFNNIPKRYPGGRYVVLYDGEGTISYKFAATKNQALSSPGRDVINVNASNGTGISLQITSTDPNNTNNYIRNIRVLPEALESSYTSGNAGYFNPTWLQRIAPFSTVRFMDWMKTNVSNQTNWSDRPTLDDTRWSTNKGVPVEVMVSLSNKGNFNPWFNMPHLASDDYVRQFAQYVKDNLAPNKKVYVEYTNEAWNWLFPQTTWIGIRAKECQLTGFKWFARRTAEVINIWKQVFGKDSHRVVGVLATQAANSWLGTTALNYLKAIEMLNAIDAIAIGPYFGGYIGNFQYANQVLAWTLDSLFEELLIGGVLKNKNNRHVAPGGALKLVKTRIRSHSELANNFNLKLLAYEFGQHLVPSSKAISELFIIANRDPRMGEIYQQIIEFWRTLGDLGDLACHYNDISSPSKYGSWGALEHLEDTDNYKFKALIAQ
jgi:hypothetical protein